MTTPPDHRIARPDFQGLRVAAFESRMAQELARLIERYGGRPLVTPALREVPLERNTEALAFGERLLAGEVDLVILLTGVGTRALLDVLATRFPRHAVLDALKHTTLVARGPKPLAALRESGPATAITVPEPHTWREILAALEARPLRGARVAVQEYGVPDPPLLAGLRDRGAEVTSVPVYRWALPDDLTPLLRAIDTCLHGEMDVVLVTNAAQVDHVMEVVRRDTPGEAKTDRLKECLMRMVVASIGPTASERLRWHGWPVDLEPSHPRMGILVKETAALAATLLERKRGLPPPPPPA